MEDKIRLEEELEFLKESFEAEVISKEEYEKAKARIEAQLKEIEAKEAKKKIEEKKEEVKEEIKEERQKEFKKEEPVEKKAEEKPKEGITKRKKEEQKKHEAKERVEAEEKEPEIEIKEINEASKFKEPEEEEAKREEELEEVKKPDEKEEDTNDIINSNNHFRAREEKKKINMWVPVAIIVFLVVIGYFSFLFFAGEKHVEEPKEILPLCFSDADCVKKGVIGFCTNAGSEDAECEFKEDVKVNFIVLNTDCFNCDTERVDKIIKGWFPGAVKKEIDFNSDEGKSLAKNLSIQLLPAYIFDSSLEETFRFNELKGIFSKINGKYVLSSSASGSTFYVNKGEVPNRLDVFLMEDDISTEKAEKNIEEFLDLFTDKIEFNKYLVNKENNLVKSLDINTFPTFLVNNKIRFSGVQPAETIKENFCKLNKLDECDEELTESLV